MLALVLGLGVAPVVGVATAAPAAAAPVGVIEASLTNHTGASGTGDTTSNCVKFDPASGTWSNGQVRAAHGRPMRETRFWYVFGWSTWESDAASPCPATLDAVGYGAREFWSGIIRYQERAPGQSVISLTPGATASVPAGSSFLLGTFSHQNSRVQTAATSFRGALGLGVGGNRFSTEYVLDEPAGTVTFSNLIRAETVTLDGMSYRLSVQGFTSAGTGNAQCAQSPTGTLSSTISTVEATTTVACLWARLDQIRPVTVVKQVAAVGDAPAVIPASTFTSDSTLAGSPWKAPAFTLTPTAITGPGSSVALAAREFRATGETLTLTDGVAGAGWELTAITCVDGEGTGLASGATVDLAARRLVLANVPEAARSAAVPITCTFLGSYVAPTTLTLISTTIPSGTAAVPTGGWSFSVDALGSPLVTGTDGSAVATIPVPDPTRVVQVTETVQAGFVFDRVSCRRNDQTTPSSTVTVNPYRLTLERGRSHTCTVVNLRASVDLVKRAYRATDTGFTSPLAAAQQRQAGTALVWRYTVRNTGQTPLRDIVLGDRVTTTPRGGTGTESWAEITCPGVAVVKGPTTVSIASLAPDQEVHCQSSGVL
ncbi:hypothetical protein [Cellulomonas sp. KH9]|uniref:prealbumin-like fold domain-containing protein n=1 Tax=Cellulomonas sp. KH9 TaxID=1855324 RepID=UPI000B7FEB22|nr:hypothetical protein [Cellulomonas sp. KH9]